MQKVTRSRGLLLAIEKIGGPTALANAIGVNRSTVNSWWRVPPERVAAVARVTGLTESEIASQ